jgi:hypothetical protein
LRDSEVEALLQKYRPANPPDGLAERLAHAPQFAIAGSPAPRAWPWAVAAAALLAVTIGLHAFAIVSAPAAAERALDAQRVQAVADQIGGPNARVVAEYIVREEQRADAEARQARMDAQPQGLGTR